MGMRGGFQKYVVLTSEQGLQRHGGLFTQRVDGRIGDLRELLPEIIVERPRLPGHDRHRRVISHGPGGLDRISGHHPYDLFTLLVGDAIKFLKYGQHLTAISHVFRGCFGFLLVVVVYTNDIFCQPVAIGPPGFQVIIDFPGSPQLALRGIYREHFTRADPPFFHHARLGVIPHADLGCQCYPAVVGHDVTGRAQTVAVQVAGSDAAVGHDDTRRSVPGLDVLRIELVEGLEIGRHVGLSLPGGRYQDTHGPEHVHTAGKEQLKHVVQR